jgi:pyridoxamine 5'-phosphate oxidase
MEDPLPQTSVDRSLLDRIVDPQARLSYAGSPLPVTSPPAKPLALLREWVAAAVEDPRVAEPNAMVVATVDADGLPNARTVLLKGLDAVGFTFFTNLGSIKALELSANPVASLVLLWHPMYRQVRVRGRVEQVSDTEAAEYFAGRPRGSQVSAWASRQSAPVASRADVERAFAEAEARWAGSAEVPMPPFWGGYRVRPVEVEFWVGQASRLHDRLVYCSRDGEPQRLDDPAAWTTTRRQP